MSGVEAKSTEKKKNFFTQAADSIGEVFGFGKRKKETGKKKMVNPFEEIDTDLDQTEKHIRTEAERLLSLRELRNATELDSLSDQIKANLEVSLIEEGKKGFRKDLAEIGIVHKKDQDVHLSTFETDFRNNKRAIAILKEIHQEKINESPEKKAIDNHISNLKIVTQLQDDIDAAESKSRISVLFDSFLGRITNNKKEADRYRSIAGKLFPVSSFGFLGKLLLGLKDDKEKKAEKMQRKAEEKAKKELEEAKRKLEETKRKLEETKKRVRDTNKKEGEPENKESTEKKELELAENTDSKGTQPVIILPKRHRPERDKSGEPTNGKIKRNFGTEVMYSRHNAKHARVAPKFSPILIERLNYITDFYFTHEALYQRIAKRVGVPSDVLCAIHYMESNLDFNTYFHCGEDLGERIQASPMTGIYFPKNTPGTTDMFELSAMHAFGVPGVVDMNDEYPESRKRRKPMQSRDYFHTVRKGLKINENTQDIGVKLALAERFNKMTWADKGEMSPYIWQGTSFFQNNHHSRRPGVFAILKAIEARRNGTPLQVDNTWTLENSNVRPENSFNPVRAA